MPLARIADRNIFYEIVGSGPPLVISAGQGTGPQARAALIAGLAEHFSVLTYDQRGTGRSEPAPQGEPIEDLATDIGGLMDAVKWPQACVMGLSTGTGMATAFATRHPHRVERLVLAAPWTHGSPEFQQIQRLRQAAARSLDPERYAEFNALLLYSPDYRRDHAARLAALALQARQRPQDAHGIAARLEAILAFDARPHYPRITCPSLVVGAQDDLIMPVWFAVEAAQAIPGARLVVLNGGGHMFPESRTTEFLAAALPFLQGHTLGEGIGDAH